MLAPAPFSTATSPIGSHPSTLRTMVVGASPDDCDISLKGGAGEMVF